MDCNLYLGFYMGKHDFRQIGDCGGTFRRDAADITTVSLNSLDSEHGEKNHSLELRSQRSKRRNIDNLGNSAGTLEFHPWPRPGPWKDVQRLFKSEEETTLCDAIQQRAGERLSILIVG